MNKVLIVFPIPHHESLVIGQCKYLNEHDIQADALLVFPGRIVFYNFSKIQLSLKFRIVYLFYSKFRNSPFYYWLKINNNLRKWLYKTIFRYYDIIELAGVYDRSRLDYVQYANCIGKKTFVCLWGTDFYGIDNPQTDWHKDLFRIVDKIIVPSKTMEEDFISVYNKYKEKLVVRSYGLSQLELLNDIMQGKIERDISFLDKRATNRIVLTIGYSARTWQQHFYALDAIDKLPQQDKENLFLLIPMTYDNTWDYGLYMKSRLDKIGIPYQIQQTRLTLIQMLSLRTISDIFICIQNTDGLAASVQEHLMAGSILIAGDWLPYKLFMNYGAYFLTTSLDNLSNMLQLVIENFQVEKHKCKNNKEVMYSASSWKKRENDYLIYKTNKTL